MPIHRRLPKRGFTNIFKKEFRIVNLDNLAKFEETEFDIKKMEDLGIIPSSQKNKKKPVKVLSREKDFNKKIVVKANAFSLAAKVKIEQFGGRAELVEKGKNE